MATALVQRRWTRKEYDYLVALGILRGEEPVELIGGRMIVAEPEGYAHATVVARTAEALRAALGRRWTVRVREPVALDEHSEPAPDVAVVRERRRDDGDAPPSCPDLIVEVAASGLAFDRSHKASLYAGAEVADYWIVNLRRRALEVYREPVAAPSAPFGRKYARVRLLTDDAVISPLAAPRATIAVARLWP
jgi:Uma2 family endonuclease